MRDATTWLLVWAFAAWLTNRYRQYRYNHRLTYDLAPPVKMIVTVALLTAVLMAAGVLRAGWRTWAMTLGAYAFVDLLITTIRFLVTRSSRRQKPGNWQFAQPPEQRILSISAAAPAVSVAEFESMPAAPPEGASLVTRYCRAAGSESGQVGMVPPAASSAAGTLTLGVADRRLNDCRRLIRYLLECHQAIANGGWLVAAYTPHDTGVNGTSNGDGALSFIMHRALPKIPGCNRLYFALTGGRDRRIARTEVWGRLQYVGFTLVDEARNGDGFVFLARKTHVPHLAARPSYYPLVVLDRVGYHGQIVKLHKVRSMYPFSEFIQKRIFEQQSLDSTGKFASDPRISGWGRFCRKYWIDELPQLLNWLRSDVKLVGIRPLSRHYFSLYPREYQEDFVRVKPGLIPPLFDEKNSSFADIVRTEGTYLRMYLSSPVKADLLQLWRTASSILAGVRSK